ncbi:MAG: EAL domain-containing protein [Plesiomonas sp.]|uniref:EAL domain-containing protein n=1 Tax=Plesiomonas sp. TaxID=2486279 RepID=UPI003F3B9B0A
MNIFCNNVWLTLRLQPIVDLNTHHLNAVEVLTLSPSDIKVEDFFNGCSLSTQKEIFLLQLRKVNRLFDQACFFHINLDAEALIDPVFVAVLLAESQVKLAIEIEYIPERRDLFLAAVSKIKQHGHQLWLDDFGRDNINFKLLNDIEWDGIKIDKEVFWIYRDNAELLKKVVMICHNSADAVIIEGIERKTDFDTAYKSGAYYGQGFLWSDITDGKYPLYNI